MPAVTQDRAQAVWDDILARPSCEVALVGYLTDPEPTAYLVELQAGGHAARWWAVAAHALRYIAERTSATQCRVAWARDPRSPAIVRLYRAGHPVPVAAASCVCLNDADHSTYDIDVATALRVCARFARLKRGGK